MKRNLSFAAAFVAFATVALPLTASAQSPHYMMHHPMRVHRMMMHHPYRMHRYMMHHPMVRHRYMHH